MSDKRDMNRSKGKKDMKSGSVLVQLYENKLLVSKVDEALDTGIPYDDIVELCKDYDFDISKASITRYKQKREEAAETGEPLIELLDLRVKNGNIIDIKDKRQNLGPINELTADERVDAAFEPVNKVYNDIQVLDEMIQKMYNGLTHVNMVDPALGLRAIETKAKLTGNQMQGLSLVGLRELKLRVQAKTTAMSEVLLQYVPEDQHEEVLEELERREQEFYANLDLSAEGKKISDALDKAGINL